MLEGKHDDLPEQAFYLQGDISDVLDGGRGAGGRRERMSAAEEPKRLRVELITPDGPVFVDDARMVVVPGKAGELGVLPRHIPLIAQLKPGETRVRTLDDEWLSFATGAGYFKIQHDRASVLVESAVPANAIDADRARSDLEDAQAPPRRGPGRRRGRPRARARRARHRRRREPPQGGRPQVARARLRRRAPSSGRTLDQPLVGRLAPALEAAEQRDRVGCDGVELDLDRAQLSQRGVAVGVALGLAAAAGALARLVARAQLALQAGALAVELDDARALLVEQRGGAVACRARRASPRRRGARARLRRRSAPPGVRVRCDAELGLGDAGLGSGERGVEGGDGRVAATRRARARP